MTKHEQNLSQTDRKNDTREPQARRELTEAELTGIIGGFNPQPEPPASSSYGPRSQPSSGGFAGRTIRGF